MNPQVPEDRTTAEQNAKIKATSSIWALATGMLGICIPLVAITESGIILPLAVILGASISTLGIWNKFGKGKDRALQAATQQTQALEERVRTLEAIVTSEERLLNATPVNQDFQ